MRLDDDGYIVRAAVIAEFAKSRGYSFLRGVIGCRLVVPLGLAAKDADVWGVKLGGKIDEAAGIS